MTTTSSHMKTLYGKLGEVGFNPKYIKSLLPDWWDDEIADTAAGLQQASLILGQRFGVRSESLWKKNAKPDLKLPQGLRFKHRDNVNSYDLSVACAVARTLASVVLKALPPKPRPDFYLDAGELRKQFLNDKKEISFKNVLTYCLNLGIPVIHLHHLPSKTKKMEGLAFEHDGRPVIVLTQNRPHGYMLFDLAHELGHITLGHVNANTTIVDQKIDRDAEDEDERAANRFALELLTGNPACKIVPAGKNLNYNELASAAIRYGSTHDIDPLHLALNYAYQVKHWQVAALAIQIIALNEPSDQKILHDTLLQHLDIKDLNEDDYTLLETHLQENDV